MEYKKKGLRGMLNESVHGKAQEKEYLHEHFTVTCILYGKIKYLDEIKHYIVKTYVEKGLLKIIKPTYSKKRLCAVNESCYSPHEDQSSSDNENSGEDFYFACVLRGEITSCERVKTYITDTYVRKGVVDLTMTPYSKEKQYIVEAQMKRNLCSTDRSQNRG